MSTGDLPHMSVNNTNTSIKLTLQVYIIAVEQDKPELVRGHLFIITLVATAEETRSSQIR